MFRFAEPIFIAGKELEMNFQAGFVCRVNAAKGKKYSLRLAASTFCRVTLNGKFLHYGPARGPHGYLRVDEIVIPANEGENLLAFEVAGYNCPSFYTLDIRSFLQCEIYEDGEVIAYTGRDFRGLSLDTYREQKAARYSYQRAFSEVYYVDSPAASWADGNFDGETLAVSDPHLEYIERGFRVPEFNILPAAKFVRAGTYTRRDRVQTDYDRVLNPRKDVKCFPYNELAHDVIAAVDADFATAETGKTTKAGQFRQFDFGRIRSGFIRTKIKASEPSVVYVVFSEKRGGDLTIPCGNKRGEILNTIMYRLPAGEFELESFECYSFRHIELLVESGDIESCEFTLREYAYPIKNIEVKTGDPVLDKTFEACRQSFRQNTIDCFMDCPGRERGGWLCDSYFTGMSSLLFTGDTECERLFLDNFQMAKLPGLPKGLLPMCYPGDNLWDSTIPQWTMWYVMEVGKFGERGGDASRYTEVVGRILGFFEGYENSDGLLEKLPYWNFVEWSKANQWVQDVNYPTNMLYTGVLRVAAKLLDRPELIEKADRIKEKIIEQSFDGEFFHDHAKRNEDGTLEPLPDRSAICQHEAVLFDIIDLSDPKYSVLDNAIRRAFGSTGDKTLAPADIEPVDLFIGFAVRVEVMMKLGLYEQNLEEIKALYGRFAELTGTIWEDRAGAGSLNHGFGSFVAVRILDCLRELRK